MVKCNIDELLKETKVLVELQEMRDSLGIGHPLYDRLTELISAQDKLVDQVTNECGSISTDMLPTVGGSNGETESII